MSRRGSAKAPAPRRAAIATPGRRGGAARAPTPHSARFRKALGVLRRIPAAAWICALVAALNGASWSLITPPFQAPDEPDHFAYVQRLAETGRLPSHSAGGNYSLEEQLALQDLNYYSMRRQPQHGAISSPAAQQRLQSDLALPLARGNGAYTGVASSQPPLYYALETIPYALGSAGTLLDRLELMRLLSALLAGVTTLFVFLFLREALPGAPWAWTVGALGGALAPLLGFMSGSVNPDTLLFATSAAIFYCLARGFHRGLTRNLAIAIGAVTAVGLLSKLNFVGLLPGVALGLVVLARRAERQRSAESPPDHAAYRWLALAIAIAVSPVVVFVASNLASDLPAFGIVSSALGLTSHGSPSGELNYIWQLYLPRLPGMRNDFVGVFTTRDIWFDGLVGDYGWLDTIFSDRVDDLALVPTAAVAILCARELLVSRQSLRRRLSELGVYATIAVGVTALVGADSYLSLSMQIADYRDPRYLLPMLALGAAILTLAARGAGRRWGAPAGALIVLVILAHDIFSQLLVISRYYG
jgi:hypothetical protein